MITKSLARAAKKYAKDNGVTYQQGIKKLAKKGNKFTGTATKGKFTAKKSTKKGGKASKMKNILFIKIV